MNLKRSLFFPSLAIAGMTSLSILFLLAGGGALPVAHAMWNGRNPCSSSFYGRRHSPYYYGGGGGGGCGIDRGCRRRGRPIDLLSDILSVPYFAINTLQRQSQQQQGQGQEIQQQERMEVSPTYDITEDETKMELAVDLPGVRAQDITVELQDGGNTLKISGTRSSRHRGRLFSSKFDQVFSLDANTIDVDKVNVTLSNGVLLVSAPKHVRKTKKRSKNIPIKELKETERIPTVLAAKAEEKLDEETVVENSNPLTEGLEITEEEDI